MFNKVELLAPAGSKETAYRAISSGVDALYMGGKLFNARKHASNFSDEELKEMVKYAHKKGVKIYITMNILLKDSEIDDAINYISFLHEIKVDAIIVQDLGLIYALSKALPEMKVHASTQMTINNKYGAKHLENINVSRVVLARELKLEEIREIRKYTDVEIEVFIHGAICMSYSGQCHMSSIYGGRSGNRGSCAQPCRMKYEIENDSTGKRIRTEGNYLLSPKDLKTIDMIDKMIDSGIDSFKIEGRMKKPEYVALVTSNYKKAIESYYKEEKAQVNEVDLKKLFNRGFTKGFIGDDFGEDFMSIDKPNNRGLFIGKILKISNNKIDILLERDISVGDGVIFGDSKMGRVMKIEKNKKEYTNINTTGAVSIILDKKIKSTTVNKDMYKVYDINLNIDIEKEFNEKANKKIDIEIAVELKTDEFPKLTAYYDGAEFIYIGDRLVEGSINNSLEKDRVREQIGKLGNTDYKIKKLNIKMSENIFIPISYLNSLRRNLIDKLDKYRIDKTIDRDSKMITINKDNIDKFRYQETSLSVKISSYNQLDYVDFNKIKRIYLPIEEGLIEAIEKVKKYKIELYIYLDRIVYDRQLEHMKKTIDIVKNRIDGISVGNIGEIQYIVENFKDMKIHGDIGLNILNSNTAKYFKNTGLDSMALSLELNTNEIKGLMNKYYDDYEVVVFGHTELMVTRNCPMAVVKKCKDSNDCKNCNYREGYSLIDRKKEKLRTKRQNGSTYIYNSKCLYIPEYIERFKNMKISSMRLDFTYETESIGKVIDIYYAELVDGKNNRDLDLNFTKGHYNKGVF